MFDINTLRDESKARIKNAIPEFAHVSDYDEAGDEPEFPAALVNIADIHPGIDPGDGRVGLLVRMTIHVITKKPEGGPRSIARKQVEALAVKAIPALHGKIFAGLESPLTFVGGYGDLGDDKHRTRSEWGLEFTAAVSVGEECWTELPDMQPPEDLFSNFGGDPEAVVQS